MLVEAYCLNLIYREVLANRELMVMTFRVIETIHPDLLDRLLYDGDGNGRRDIRTEKRQELHPMDIDHSVPYLDHDGLHRSSM